MSPARRILVIRPGALGDTILTLPALSALRAAWPSSHITFAGNPAMLPLLAGRSPINSTISMDDPVLAVLFMEGAPVVPDVGAAGSETDSASETEPVGPRRDSVSESAPPGIGNPDLAVVWLRDSALVAANLRRLGARTVIEAPSRPAEGRAQHVSDYLLETIAPELGPRPAADPRGPALALTPEDRGLADDFWRRHGLSGERVVALHPGSGGRWKCWPAGRFAALADALASRGFAVLLAAGPADEIAVDSCLSSMRLAHPVVARQLALPLFAALLARCAALAGNDSGVSHLAAAVGTPTVAVFGPTDPCVWGVRGRRVRILYAPRLMDIAVGDMVRAVIGAIHP